MTTPRLGLPYVPENTLNPAAGLNLALDDLDTLVQTEVLSMSLTAPPGSPNDGDLYIPAATATGAWSGQENNLAKYVEEGDFWRFFTAGTEVVMVLNRDDGTLYYWDSGWTEVSGGGGGAGGSEATAVDLTMFFPGNPGSSQLLYKIVAPRNITLPANFSGARGDIGTNPTSSFVMDVSVSGSDVGTITVSTGGGFTFASDGGLPVEVLDTEVIEITAPSSTDGTAADIAVTIPASLTE